MVHYVKLLESDGNLRYTTVYYGETNYKKQNWLNFAFPAHEPCSSSALKPKQLSEFCKVEERAGQSTSNCLSREGLGEKDPELIRLILN